MKNQYRREVLVVAALVASTLGAAAPGNAQLQWKSADEKLAFKIGFLGQLQAESVDVPATDDTAQNLFIRRARLVMNFSLGEKFSVFLDTDSPNLGKSSATGAKDTGDMFIQDLVVGWKFTPAVQLEGGLLLPALSYNGTQSAASLLAVDYGPYSFVTSAPLTARVGRDYGLQIRGYANENHFEYRAGMLQGARGVNASNNLRYFGRVMYQFFTPQTGLFYRGTSLGKTKTVAIGASYDAQEDYSSYAFDFFADLPMKNGNGLTFQVDWANVDGDVFLATLPEQTDTLAELGFYFSGPKLMPFVQWAEQSFDDEAGNDEERLGFGLAFFPSGHNHTVKLSYTQIDPEVGDKRDQILVQWQVFQF